MRRRARGFSLIELMIVVSIIGVLAAVAYPQFLLAEYRARKSEVDIILGKVKETQLGWYGAHDCFVSLRPTPEGGNTPGRTREPWVSNPTPGADPCTDAHGFADTEIQNETAVYFTYQCVTRANPADYTCTAVADLDADGVPAEYLYCSDFQNTGAGCLATPTGAVSFFPFEVDRSTPNRW